MDISLQLEILEKMLGIQLVYHDVHYRYFSSRKIACQRQYLNLHYRHPEHCPIKEVASCVKHCVVKLRNKLLLEHPASLLWRCRKGYVQVVAPVFRDGVLTGVLFAGLWQRPLDKDAIRRIVAVLPVIADGLTARMEDFLAEQKENGGFAVQVMDFLEEHYQENITLQDLAHRLALSPSRTCHRVTEYFGKPFTRLLLELRLEKSCRFLRERHLSVNETARLCAFGSVNYFSSAFRQKFGISPKVYQQKYDRKANTFK